MQRYHPAKRCVREVTHYKPNILHLDFFFVKYPICIPVQESNVKSGLLNEEKNFFRLLKDSVFKSLFITQGCSSFVNSMEPPVCAIRAAWYCISRPANSVEPRQSVQSA